jgi:LysR family transcriptional regulator, transcriptional activator of nhaA
MSDLNYLHLQYFWAVARSGSVAAASKQLGVGMSTISAQIKKLERSLGGALFNKAGRGLELTELGKQTVGYADEIFAIGSDLVAAVRNQQPVQRMRFRVGVADAVPKLIAYNLLAPALQVDARLCLEVIEEDTDKLCAQLALHELDLVIADRTLPAAHTIRAYNHRLGESRIAFFAAPALAQRLSRQFPQSLDGEPLILPDRTTALCTELEIWLQTRQIRPRLVAHLADSALAKVFAAEGHGVIAAPMAVRTHLAENFGLRLLGPCEGMVVRYYAISIERRIRHPAVLAISRAARISFEDDLSIG